MNLQIEFLAFHDRIKLDYDVKAELADKRDILVKILRNSGKLPGFEILNQGSYSMYTGVEPLEGKEYDIDVGLRFNVNSEDYEPMDLKNKIEDILKNHTEYGASIKSPCVTVTYKKDGEPAYHIDLVAYAYEDKEDHDSQMYLARGKSSRPEEIKWEKSDPKGLIDYINNAVDEADCNQYRRVIRYLKRWKNIKFNSDGHAEPASIGITLIAADYFEAFSVGDGYDDFNAIISLVKNMKTLFRFVGTSDKGRMLYRIKYPMPKALNFESDTDAFSKMSDSQMTDFKDKLEKLIKDLESVESEADEIKQYEILHKIFGDDFHVPDAKDISKQQANYIPSSSASGAKYL
ncbi:MAG: nucleotidyltransferase [Ruminococcus flavefaciens]|nr:nucleotidyltransferase [Ruminococcus flavefaciens]